MITYNCVREDVADGVISLTHVMSENNYSGLLIKSLSGTKNYDMETRIIILRHHMCQTDDTISNSLPHTVIRNHIVIFL